MACPARAADFVGANAIPVRDYFAGDEDRSAAPYACSENNPRGSTRFRHATAATGAPYSHPENY